ncbi:hypothetical protein D049_1811B, partial [Vibrio parahaemolyticus VPTS-2010]|jgi:riboflavin biosynthesis pyrimidine reductase
VR